jgi:N-formylglutamate amidohydrolase
VSEDFVPFIRFGPDPATCPLVLDSPHSGRVFPSDFDAAVSESDLRDGEDSHIDALYAPAAERGIPMLAATFARTYIDANRHEADLDPELLDAPWPAPLQPSGKAALGKALIWRLLDDGRPIYRHRLTVAEVSARIERCHRPYHAELRRLLDSAHARFGRVLHLNLHSMKAISGAMGVGGPGRVRPDIVLGDRDGSTCEPALTEFVRATLAGLGYDVRINDPYKGMELVRAFSDPARGRHSLQIELNQRLYMDAATREPIAQFHILQGHLMTLLDRLTERLKEESSR